MKRVFNFSAGPSCLPLEVLETAAAEMTDYKGSGQSVMEMSHRSKVYEPIIGGTESLVRELLSVPENYDVLFLQGGASTQFAMVPMNLKKKGRAAYIDTGVWSDKAIKEAGKYLEVDVLATSKDRAYSYIPAVKTVSGGYDYAHITLNNTIVGTAWQDIPECGDIPLVTDASSCILSGPLDVSRFGIIYAGAQKNLGPAGVTLVIIRKDLVTGETVPGTPTMLNYKIHADNDSMYNTPPCYSIYMMGLVLEWVKRNGGAEGMLKRNREKAKLFYDFLDSGRYYKGTAEKESRSLMNIPFVTGETDPEKAAALNKKFVAEATAAGLVNLAGHRLVGGMRASIYNAMGLDGVKALIAFMEQFSKANG
ncbi:MAG: 3-phosphoserine/phosphohydroxythreonine transaminase [Spirochaetaceae bacterium]|jgi:phosphoserine aminotransferase|nr:3-phosphoserine/phosphohydroxythreonine transaminase [Spirochaetaceae bacterium]